MGMSKAIANQVYSTQVKPQSKHRPLQLANANYNFTSCNSKSLIVPNVAFIKTYKTGSTTLAHIINRFGFSRNLSFVLSRVHSNGHLYITPLSEYSRPMFLPPINVAKGNYEKYRYNMIAVHVRYYRTAMDSFMLPNTRYITILREPAAQFESAFVHFQFDDSFNSVEKLRATTPLKRLRKFFERPFEYRRKLKRLVWEGTVGLRYYYSRNSQIFSLGLEDKFHGNEEVVRDYIFSLAKELDVVLITEYFEESLLILKKRFCWSIEDVLFISKNVRVERSTLPLDLKQNIWVWNAADVELYNHFNKTLWKSIENYGPSFTDDLQEFRKMLQSTYKACAGETVTGRQGHYFRNKEVIPAVHSGELCYLLAQSKRALVNKIRNKQLGQGEFHSHVNNYQRIYKHHPPTNVKLMSSNVKLKRPIGL